jgi:hypothetical protein
MSDQPLPLQLMISGKLPNANSSGSNIILGMAARRYSRPDS